MIIKSLSFYLAILGILLTIIYSNISGKPIPAATSAQQPSISPFSHDIAASGIVEAIDKNIEVGCPEEGLVEHMWVSVGDHVKKNTPLFQLDTRKLKAKLFVQEANIEVAKARL